MWHAVFPLQEDMNHEHARVVMLWPTRQNGQRVPLINIPGFCCG